MADEEPAESDFDDLLGSGALLKKTLREGTGRKPDHGQTCFVAYTAWAWDPELGQRKDTTSPATAAASTASTTSTASTAAPPVEVVVRTEVTIGDDDFGISGIELVVRLMTLGEVALIRLDPRFGYAEHARPGSVDASTHLEVELEVLEVGPVAKSLHEMTVRERIDVASVKKGRGNAHFRAGRTVLAARLYKLAVSFVKDGRSNDDVSANDDSLDAATAAAQDAERVEVLVSGRNNLAMVREKLGLPDDAWATAKAVLVDDPDNTKALFRLGQVALGRNDADQAALYLGRAAEQAPEDSGIRRALREVGKQRRGQRAKEAEMCKRMMQPATGKDGGKKEDKRGLYEGAWDWGKGVEEERGWSASTFRVFVTMCAFLCEFHNPPAHLMLDLRLNCMPCHMLMDTLTLANTHTLKHQTANTLV